MEDLFRNFPYNYLHMLVDYNFNPTAIVSPRCELRLLLICWASVLSPSGVIAVLQIPNDPLKKELLLY